MREGLWQERPEVWEGEEAGRELHRRLHRAL